jgi:hypothetical protein
MPVNFFTLPRELRDKIYELCLLLDEPINPWDGFCREPDNPWDDLHLYHDLAPGLLGVNKTINSETRFLLYRNCFDFTTANPEMLSSFLETIGNNADCIRHVYVNFPSLYNLSPGYVSFGEDDTRIFASIQSSCVNLRTLTTSRVAQVP